MIKSATYEVRILILFLLELLIRLKKLMVYSVTGKHEFERICESHCDIYEKTIRISQWIKRSKYKQIRNFIPKNELIINEVQKTLSLSCRDHQHQPNTKKSSKRHGSKSIPKGDNCRSGRIEDADLRLTMAIRTSTRDFLRLIKNYKRVKLSKKIEEMLSDTLYRIICYDTSVLLSDKLASIKYDAEIYSHSSRVLSLWNNLVKSDNDVSNVFPEVLRKEITSRSDIVSNRWSHIGFQGEDPGTDFRGMGMLGLTQLEYLSRRPKCLARDLLKRSLNESHSYPLAIVGINVTYNLLNLYKEGSLKHLYYDTREPLFSSKKQNLKIITTIYDLYVELFLRFDCYWHDSKPENIFAFRELMEKFIDIVKVDLRNRTFSFKFIY